MHHAEILACAYVLRQDWDASFFLLISKTRFLLRADKICKAQKLVEEKNNKINKYIYDSVLRIFETYGNLLIPFNFHNQLMESN